MVLINLVNYAVNYAKHGFSVIPVAEDKRPLIKFANKPALTPDEIRKFWKFHPLAGIALKTDKFIVIDVDRHGGEVDGLDSIEALNHNEWFKDTLTEKTAHGGYHFYFKKPVDTQITQTIGILPSVDLKAHKNNYVVVAPTAGYKWLNHTPMKNIPDGLLKFILDHQDKEPKYQAKNLNYSTGKTQTSALFETIVNGLGPTGGRNDALTSFIGGLLFRNVDPKATRKLAYIANECTDNKLSKAEVDRTVDSMVAKEIQRRKEMDGRNG